jgi:SAM-dependent methyltransferase
VKRCSSGHVYESPEWQCPHCGDRPLWLDGHLAFAPALAKNNDGFAAEYFPKLAKLEQGHFWFESRNRLLVWAFQRHIPNASSFLEIGCGTGFVLAAVRRCFPQMRLSGSEMFSAALPFAASRLPGTTLFQMDARVIPFESEFDAIGAFDVLEHIVEDETVLREMHRALQPGGSIVLTVPQHPLLWSAVDEYSYHKRRYTRPELAGKVRAAGFEIQFVTSFVSVLMPLLLLSRLRRKRYTTDFDPYAEFKIGNGVNRILTKALEWEQSVIRHGVSLPFGGSLLVVARRAA